MRKSGIFTLFFLVLLMGSVYGSSLEIEAIDRDISPEEKALFQISYVNTDDYDKSIGVLFDSPKWKYTTNPYFLNVKANSENVFELFLEPRTDELGLKVLPVRFRIQPGNESYSEDMYVYVKEPVDKLEYTTILSLAAISNKEKFIPGDEFSLKSYIRNLNPKRLDNVTLKIISDLFEKSFDYKIGSRETKENTYSFKFDDFEPPLKDEVIIELYDGNSLEESVKIPYEVVEYSPDLSYVVNKDSGFLKSYKKVNLTYMGNYKTEKSFELSDSGFQRFFRSFETSKNFTVEKNNLSAVFSPGENVVIYFKYNYVLLFVLSILLIASGVVYWILKKPLQVRKEVKRIYEVDGIKKVRMIIYLKNKTGAKIHNLRIKEILPSIVSYEPIEEFGVLKPKYVHDKEKSFDMVWEFRNFEPFEERILTYDIKAKFDIIGKLKIPATELSFEFLGIKRILQSNNILIRIKNKRDNDESR